MTGSGLFVTFEGGDGAGKSTQLTRLHARLAAMNVPVTVTREPGGTDFGRQVREILLHSTDAIESRAEALMYAADRAHHVANVVRPALERGDVVLQDRYIDSSLAYQGAGRGLPQEDIRRLSEWATGGLWPDLTVLLDIDPAAARRRSARLNANPDRIEAAGDDFHHALRRQFRTLAEREPQRFLVVDATLPAGVISNRVVAAVEILLWQGSAIA